MNAQEVLKAMTLEEKAAFCSGRDFYIVEIVVWDKFHICPNFEQDGNLHKPGCKGNDGQNIVSFTCIGNIVPCD